MSFIPWAKVKIDKRETGSNYEIFVSLEDHEACFNELRSTIIQERLRPEFYTRAIIDTKNDCLKEIIYCKIAKEKSESLMKIIEKWTKNTIEYVEAKE